ncbi:MAG: hypothetical protein PUD70_09170 [Firmicutes bacterium]|nr:hypothetical protein [Bacillota bacterium]
MRKFLSILMLACLLCGMVLPAGAEGELQLYAKVGTSDVFEKELPMPTDGELSVRFYTAEDESTLITAEYNFFTPDEGFNLDDPDDHGVFKVTASESYKHKNYILTYSDGEKKYAITFMGTPRPVTPATSLEIPSADLGVLEGTDADFLAYLTGKGYSGSGDFTIILPPEDLDKITCNVQLPGNATLTLKGAAELKTNVKDGITITVPNVHLDGIKFTDAGAVTVDPGCNLAVSNCSFKGSGYAFQLKQDADGKVARLTLTANSFDTYKMASILSAEDMGEIGRWRAEQPIDSGTVEIDFGVTVVEKKTGDEIEALHINVSSSKAALVNKGWGFSFLTDCDFNDAYAVFSRKKTTSSFLTEQGKKQILIGGQNKGEYIVVNDSYPKLVKKNDYYELPITDRHKSYLDEVTVDSFPYAAADITLNGKTVDYSIKTANGARSLIIPNLKAGTYTIKETTKTVTKTTTTKTTSRSYNYKYQDYYRITPQRVTDCMRYAKDNLVTIECKEAGRRSISLPVASMAAAAEKGYSILLKNEKIADITIDAAALKSLAQQAKGTTVLLHYRSLNHKTLSTVGQASVQSHLAQYPNDSADLAFLVTATSDSETIEDLQRGAITLKIPFIVLPGTEEDDNVVYALQGESVAEARETTVADGYLTTKLLDLTEHMVFQVGEPVETTEETTEPTVETTEETTQPETEAVTEVTQPPEPEETDQGFPIWIPIVVAALLAGGGAAAYFLILRKRMKK